jgi:hypothetical protein
MPCVRRSCDDRALHIRETGVPGVRSASIDAAEIPTTPGDEVALTADIIELARQYGRYGYRWITALLRRAG